MKGYVLFNPAAGCGAYMDSLDALELVLDGELVFIDITKVTNYRVLLGNLEAEDYLVIAGGDGTLNRFVNDTDGIKLHNDILYCPIGRGNDFARDLRKEAGDNPFQVTQYLKELPVVTVKGKQYRFLNGVGYGLDGYCCEVADAQRKAWDKKVNYRAIAVKGLLFHYRPTRATVTVDGVVHTYDKVWLAPTMYGRFYSGGMMPVPRQDRSGGNKTLSVMVLHSTGKLKTLTVLPSVFTGKHVRHRKIVEILTGHRKIVEILTGHRITVEFDRPTALQIDGETILSVTGYTAVSGKLPAGPLCESQ